MPKDLDHLVAAVRSVGGDWTDVEVKSGVGGLPVSLTSTLSAFANHPGGGTIVLGLDENNGFRPVRLENIQILKQGLAKKARSFTPPVQLTIEDSTVDGEPIVVAIVHECAPSAKPCRVSATGAAYLRGYDGDFRMSALEEQALRAAREPPLFDRAPVEGATRTDLDEELIEDFAHNVRLRDRSGLGRFSGDELLLHAGALTAERLPTVAGLLALGVYPQQWFPRYVIQAAAEPRSTDPPDARARNQATITGPIPRMLDTAMEWAEQTFDSAIVTRSDGTVVDVPAYPLAAFRELIANALLHRDVDRWSAGMAVEVRLRRDRLIIGNPGGLYGITLDRLGREAVTSARNMWLVNICQYLRSPTSRGRVVEGLATGIPTIAGALAQAGLPPAIFTDSGIRFTAVLTPRTEPDPTPWSPGTDQAVMSAAPASSARERKPIRIGTSDVGAPVTTKQRIVDLLAEQPRGVDDLRAHLGMSASGIRKALNAMGKEGRIEQIGGRGRSTVYQLKQ